MQKSPALDVQLFPTAVEERSMHLQFLAPTVVYVEQWQTSCHLGIDLRGAFLKRKSNATMCVRAGAHVLRAMILVARFDAEIRKLDWNEAAEIIGFAEDRNDFKSRQNS